MNDILTRISSSTAGMIVRKYRHPIIAAIVVLVLTLFISQNLDEVSRISAVVRNANPYLLALALFTNVVVVAAAGLSYRIVLGKLGHTQPWAWLANLHLKRHLVGTVTPVGGPASIYVFVRCLGQRGVQASDALFAAAIRSISGYAGFMLLLAPVLFLSDPPTYIFAGAVGLFILLAVLLSGLLLVLRESCNPHWLMSRLHPKLRDLIVTARGHHLRPVDFAKPFGMAVIHNSLGVLTLYLSLLAVGYEASLATAVIAYAIGNLFMLVAPVFQGVGVVEVTMAVALQQLGVPVPAAIAATLLFRFCDLWFPFLLGVATHAPQVEQVRRVTSQVPAMMTAALGVLVLLMPLLPNPMTSALSIPTLLVPTVAVVAGAWFLLLAYSLWCRKAVAQISIFGGLIVFLPILAFQAPWVLDVSAAFLP